jgi:hypothetical protein
MHQLWFSHAHSYPGQESAITLPVVLRSGDRLVDLIASLDTGASSCLFESGYAAGCLLFADQAIRKNVLGGRGWLDRLRLAIVDYEHALYLGAYE